MPAPTSGLLRRHALFRALWLASLFSNLGAWMREVGAGWLITSLAPTPEMVALVQASATLPLFLLALPAGALADLLDRRKLLLVTNGWLMVTSLATAVLIQYGWMSAWLLLVLTFLSGLGAALMVPAWQAIISEMVARDDVAEAVALNAVGFNAARSVGPALGGLLVAAGGPQATYFLNALSYVAVLYVLYRWQRESTEQTLPSERFVGAMRAGLRYVRHDPAMRVLLVRTAGFVVSGSCLWALLPLLARQELKSGPTGYGILLGCFGVGAVLAGIALQRLRQRFTTDVLVNGGSLVYAASMGVLGVARTFEVACLVMFVGGASWLALLSCMNVAAQAVLPAWVRARALAVYLLVFFGGFAGGSVLWGLVAGRWGYDVAYLAAAASLALGVPILGRRHSLAKGEGFNPSPSRHWPAPTVVLDVPPERGPVLITVTYVIDPARAADFALAMRAQHAMHKRDGAIRWGLWVDAADPTRYVESYVMESWVAHLRQHERVTVTDLDVERRVHAFHLGQEPPRVAHLLYAYE